MTGSGYPPNDDRGPYNIPATDKLVTWDIDGNTIPVLAESWEGDPVNKTFTWHLRKGVKFDDGTTFNAEAARWNIQRLVDLGRQIEGDNIKSMDVVDDYTLRMNLKEYTNQAAINYGWVLMYSPTAIKINGDEWAKTHQVGVGPFRLVNWVRDVSVTFERVNNYWNKGYPYLDGIKFLTIPDTMTASAVMETGEADMWMGAGGTGAPARNALDLENKGFKVNWGRGVLQNLFPNSKDPGSKYANKKVREALEYALDRPGIANGLGYGKFEPLTQMAPSGSTGYIPGYDPRPYNAEKARQLLAEAGYPNGFKTKILCQASNQELASAIQGYLLAVGIQAEVDLADSGRYYGEFYGKGWSELAVGVQGNDCDYIVGFLRHYGPIPMLRITSLNKSPEFLALCDKAIHTYDAAGYKAVTQELVRQATEDAMVIPIYRTPGTLVMQKYVHSDILLVHAGEYHPYRSWMEKH